MIVLQGSQATDAWHMILVYHTWLQVYSRLSERLGLADHPALLSVILNKLAKNLTVYARHEVRPLSLPLMPNLPVLTLTAGRVA